MICSKRDNTASPVRPLVSVALLVVMALAVAGCKTLSPEATGSLGMAPAPTSEADARTVMEAWADRYRAMPTDADTAINYAQALRSNGQRQQAVAVLEQASLQHPKNMTLLGAYGRALADNGAYKQALEVLGHAHSPEQPDWRILSVQGAVLDQMGRHEEAQRYYATALRIVPDEPSVLSNLGLSYALSKDLVRAETTLRRASVQSTVDPRVRQNLALVVGLQGRFQEAESIARADLPTEAAAANVAYLRQMLAQQNGMKTGDGKPSVRAQGS
jgi:Flp pilus assembly protein TadD